MTPLPTSAPGARALASLAHMPAWLTAPADPSRVSEELCQIVPELADGSLTIVKCTPKLRIKSDRPGWTASYELVVSGGEDERRVRLSGTFVRPGVPGDATATGAFGTLSWQARVPALGLELATRPADDAGLPALATLTSPETARALLEEAIGTPIRSAVPDVRRYKPASRCTIFYDLELDEGSSAPSAVVAKTYRGDKGANSFAGMRALQSAGLGADGSLALAEPLAYLPELRVLVQGAVAEEMTLKELLRAALAGGQPATMARLRQVLARAAAGLARMHASGVHHGETVTWSDELADVRELLERLGPWLPDVASATGSLLDDVAGQEAEVPPQPEVPSHRSFRPAQVLLDGDRIAFIDFDGLCMAEPALDVAMFRAALRDAGTRALPADASASQIEAAAETLDALGDEFAGHYTATAPLSPPRVALWETLHLLTSVLHCWTKIKPERLPARIALLARHLARR